MKNGAGRAVLLTELLYGEGPYHAVAEDFLALRCSSCRRSPADDALFRSDAFLCTRCDEETSFT